MTFKEAVSDLGVNKSAITNANDLKTPLELYLQKVGQVFIEKMRDKLTDEDANASFLLAQSLTADPDREGVEFFSDEEYALFRNDGVSGTEVIRQTPFSFRSTHPSIEMVNDIRQWIRAKGFIAPEWAVATNVLKKGFEGAKYIETAFNEENLRIFENDMLQVVDNAMNGILTNIEPQFKN